MPNSLWLQLAVDIITEWFIVMNTSHLGPDNTLITLPADELTKPLPHLHRQLALPCFRFGEVRRNIRSNRAQRRVESLNR